MSDMKLAMKLIAITALTMCTGCNPKPDTGLGVSVPTNAASRISVTRIGVFEDEIAYGDLRGIYIITDSKTGREYVGVSGIGISELGSHSAGKAIVSDER